MWQTSNWRETTLAGHAGAVKTIQFVGHDRLITGSDDGTVRAWNTHVASSETLSRQTAAITDVAYALDGDLVASSSDDGTVALWQKGRNHLLLGHQDKVRAVALAPDGSLLVSGGQDGSIRIWRTSDGALLDVLAEHTSFVMDVGFLPDGKTFASASIDRTLRLWPVRGAEIAGTSPMEVIQAMNALTSFHVAVAAESRLAR